MNGAGRADPKRRRHRTRYCCPRSTASSDPDCCRQRRGAASVPAAGDIAPGVVAAGVDLVGGTLRRTRRARLVDPGQLVRMGRVAVEVLVLLHASVERCLPDLAQVGVDEAIGVACVVLGAIATYRPSIDAVNSISSNANERADQVKRLAESW